MEIKAKHLHETSDLNDLSYLELKLLRSSLHKWDGALYSLDKDLLAVDEESVNQAYKNLMGKLNSKLRATVFKN